MEFLLTNKITNLADHRPVTRSREEIGQMEIDDALSDLQDMNGSGALTGVIYIGIARDGKDHLMGIAGEDGFMDPIDISSILELHRQSILMARGYVET